jgi:maleate isomerase
MALDDAPPIEHVDVTPGAAPGRRARIGLLLLATDYATEHELRDFMPHDGALGPDAVAWVASRVPNANPVTVANLRGMAPDLARSAGTLLPGARLDALAYGCTSGSIAIGTEAVRAQIAAGRPDVPITTPAAAVQAAFAAMGVSRLSVLTPYDDEINASIAGFLRDDGRAVTRFLSFHLDSDEAMSGVAPADVAEAAAACDTPESDAVFISCTALKAVGIVPDLEARLGKPVITSNQAMFWHALRLAGIADALPGRGALLQRRLDGSPSSQEPT